MGNLSLDEEIAALRQRVTELENKLEDANQLKQEVYKLKVIQETMHAAIQQMEDRYYLMKQVIDKTLDWIIVKDKNYRCILANHTAAHSIGKTIEEVIGKNDLELGLPEELVFGNPDKNIRGFRTDDEIVLSGQTIHNPYDIVTVSDGSWRILDTQKVPLRNSSGEIFALLGVCRDITDRHRAQEELRESEAKLRQRTIELEATLKELRHTQSQLIQSEKMSSLGQLVAGVAHEINNPINFIYGNLIHASKYAQDLIKLLKLYQKYYPDPGAEISEQAKAIELDFLLEDMPDLISSMKFGTERIQEIVDCLRTFSRLDQAELKLTNIHEGIDSTLMLLEHRLKPRPNTPTIKVTKQYGNLPLVECYAGQLNQVFMNILANAIDALEGVGIKNSQSKIEHPEIHISTNIPNPEQIRICIADNGMGIPERVIEHIFGPFYTTKPVGRGTGLGLSISYQIITDRHGGLLDCISSPGKGAKFIITIPIQQTSNSSC